MSVASLPNHGKFVMINTVREKVTILKSKLNSGANIRKKLICLQSISQISDSYLGFLQRINVYCALKGNTVYSILQETMGKVGGALFVRIQTLCVGL